MIEVIFLTDCSLNIINQKIGSRLHMHNLIKRHINQPPKPCQTLEDVLKCPASLHQASRLKETRLTCPLKHSWGDPRHGQQHHQLHQQGLQLHLKPSFQSYPAKPIPNKEFFISI